MVRRHKDMAGQRPGLLSFIPKKKKKRKNWQLSNDKRQLGLQLEVNPRGGENVAEPKAAKDIWEWAW